MFRCLKIIIFYSSLLFCSPNYLMNLLPRFHLLLFHSLIPFFSHFSLTSQYLFPSLIQLFSFLAYLTFYSTPSFSFSHSLLTFPSISLPHSALFPFLVSYSSLFLPLTLIQTFPSSYPPSLPFSLLPPPSSLLTYLPLLSPPFYPSLLPSLLPFISWYPDIVLILETLRPWELGAKPGGDKFVVVLYLLTIHCCHSQGLITDLLHNLDRIDLVLYWIQFKYFVEYFRFETGRGVSRGRGQGPTC